jgi:pimeloyl-ACP methyl ester carboxylesterase
VGRGQLRLGAHPGANRGPRRAGLAGHHLKAIPHSTLVVNGNHDVVVATVNSYILQQNLPNAELILFPDSNHGSHFQFTEQFNRYLTDFIDLRPEIPIPVG